MPMDPTQGDHQLKEVLQWCASIVGAFEIASDDPRLHGRTSVYRLKTSSLSCYLKIHRERAAWEREVCGHEHWAVAFGSLAPKVLGVYEAEPGAVLFEALPGQIMEKARLSVRQEETVWHAAGRALAGLHRFVKGKYFGSCRRDDSVGPDGESEATEFVSAELEKLAAQSVRASYLSDDEMAVVNNARDLVPAFARERPTPCHRDYCPDNWLVNDEGNFAGVIDFEFSRWDVRVADLSRYPGWEWMHKPNLLEAFFDGYGLSLTPEEERQLLVARTQYALEAIVWGNENAYYGFVEEGRQALGQLAKVLG